jgi:hypothetical protein
VSDGTYALLRRAIEERLQVDATYGGHQRRLCPHVLGTKDGEPQALFFQFAGGSRKGLEPGGGWRCLPLAGLGDVSAHDGEWHSKPHSQPQHCIDAVDLEVGP